jgi:hypothetical protein
MKRLMLFFAALVMCGAMYAQGVFTVVGGDAYDGFVSIRQSPSSKARVLGKLYNTTHGLGSGIKLGQQGNWTKVKYGNVVGWCYSKYVMEQTWWDNHRYMIVAAKPNTPIYGEDYVGEGDHPLFARVAKGTIIAGIDNPNDNLTDDGYYMLRTAHDNLFVRKSDVIVKRRY